MKKISVIPVSVPLLLFAISTVAGHTFAQAKPVERTFSNPLSEIQQVVDDVKSSSSGRLPILEGFVDVGDRLRGDRTAAWSSRAQVLSNRSWAHCARLRLQHRPLLCVRALL